MLDEHAYKFDATQGLFLREGDAFKPYMNPAGDLMQHCDQLDPQALHRRTWNLCQIQRHRLLESYINFTPMPRLPLRVKAGQRLKQQLVLLRKCFELLQRNGRCDDLEPLIKTYKSMEQATTLHRRDLANLLALAYRLSPDGDLLGEAGETQLIGASLPLTDAHTQGRNLAPIAALREAANKTLSPWMVDVMLHGSYSTRDFCAYSDLDTLVILRADVITDPDQLTAAAKDLRPTLKYLYQLDALQHHGHFVIAEQDLCYYPDTFFPQALWAYATSLLDDRQGKTFSVTPRNCKLEQQHALWSMCYSFRESYLSHRFPRTAFEFKLYLSKIMLLPAMYLQALSKPCYKRESFALARPNFDSQVWSIVEEATQKRAAWKNPLSWRMVMQLATRCSIHPVLGSAFANRISQLKPASSPRYVDASFYTRATLFAEQILSHLSREACID